MGEAKVLEKVVVRTEVGLQPPDLVNLLKNWNWGTSTSGPTTLKVYRVWRLMGRRLKVHNGL
jgi:hypothetical protein